jgi:co-chaperonin GroES (HSP10)
MNINTGYIAIKEVSYDSLRKRFTIQKKFDGEPRFVEVIGATKDSIFNVGDIAIHEKAIPYFIAEDLGENCFYIPENEINSKIVDGNIISVNELVYVDVDKKSKHSIDIKGNKLKIDYEYNEFREDIVTQYGTVLSIPLKATDSYFPERKINIELLPGDTVYAHHFISHEDNEIEFNGIKACSIRYEVCYVRIRDGHVKAINDYNLLAPILEDESSLKISGFIKKRELENDTMRARVVHPSDKLLSMGVSVGDVVYFKKDCDKKIDFEGEIMFVINSRDIVAID